MELYCIKHQKMVHAERASLCPMGHLLDIGVDLGDGLVIQEPDYCCFDLGWAFNHPPDAESDPYMMDTYQWMLWIAEAQPSDTEIFIADINALSLLLEIEND